MSGRVRCRSKTLPKYSGLDFKTLAVLLFTWPENTESSPTSALRVKTTIITIIEALYPAMILQSFSRTHTCMVETITIVPQVSHWVSGVNRNPKRSVDQHVVRANFTANWVQSRTGHKLMSGSMLQKNATVWLLFFRRCWDLILQVPYFCIAWHGLALPWYILARHTAFGEGHCILIYKCWRSRFPTDDCRIP